MTLLEFAIDILQEIEKDPKKGKRKVVFATEHNSPPAYYLSIYNDDKKPLVWIDIGWEE